MGSTKPDEVQYDKSLGHTQQIADSAGATNESDLPAFLTCDRCGKIFVHLRIAIFYRVWSLIIISSRSSVAGIFCPHCRSTLAWQTALFSALLGPWGFWGFFYTIQAFIAAISGGEKPVKENAELLRYQGYAFGSRGHYRESYTNLIAAQKIQYTADIAELLKTDAFSGLQALPTTRWLRGQTWASTFILLPFIVVGLVVLSFATNPPAHETPAAPASITSRVVAIYAACRDADNKNAVDVIDICKTSLADFGKLRDAVSTQGDRQAISFGEALTQLSIAHQMARANQSEAAEWFNKGLSTVKWMAANAQDRDLRAVANKWRSCLVDNRCDAKS